MEQHAARDLLLRALTTVAHREYDQIVPVMHGAMEDDPLFTGKALVYFARESNIRDVVDCAIVALMQSPVDWLEYRQAGQAIALGDSFYNIKPSGWPGLPPKRLFRVLDYISESDKPTPRRVRDTVTRYFEVMEEDERRAEGAFTGINLRRAKSYWIKYHINPKTYPFLHELFFGEVVEGSKRWALGQLTNASPVEKLELVKRYNIGYQALQSVLDPDNMADLAVMVYAMTPTQALNSRAWVEKSGVLNASEVKTVFAEKLSRATSVSSIDHRESAKGEVAELDEALAEAKERAAKKARKLDEPVLLMVDKSGSMMGGKVWCTQRTQGESGKAIRVGKMIATRIATLLTDKRVVAFDSSAFMIDVGDTVESAERAFKGLVAGGGTSAGKGYEVATSDGWKPEFVIIVTDANELHSPFLSDALGDDYPEIIIVKVENARDTLSGPLSNSGRRVTTFQWNDDYYLLEQLESIISAGSLADRIMETQIPKIVR